MARNPELSPKHSWRNSLSSSAALYFTGALTFLLLSGKAALPAEVAKFSVKFTETKAIFTGHVPSKEYGEALAGTVKQSRPDIKIVNDDILVDQSMEMPPLEILKSVLEEIELSMHEGKLSVDDQSITVSGLTDSMVTVTAITIRLEPIRDHRQIITHICIVPTEDLPVLPVYLSDGKRSRPSLDFEPIPKPADLFVVPGILPEKLLSLVTFGLGKPPSAKSQPYKLRAVPTTTIHQSPLSPRSAESAPSATASLQSQLPGSDQPETPRPWPTGPSFLKLNPVLYSRNTFLLQANQEPVFLETVKQLKSPQLSGKKIIIRVVKPATGATAFNEWLCDRRAEDVKQRLADRGIPTALLSSEVVASKNTIDTGEVGLFVQIPAPQPTTAPNSSTEKNATAVEGPKQAQEKIDASR